MLADVLHPLVPAGCALEQAVTDRTHAAWRRLAILPPAALPDRFEAAFKLVAFML
jgi:hypothetical protein